MTSLMPSNTQIVLFNAMLMMQSFIVHISDYSPVLVKAIDHLTEPAQIWQLRIANNKCIAHCVSTIK